MRRIGGPLPLLGLLFLLACKPPEMPDGGTKDGGSKDAGTSDLRGRVDMIAAADLRIDDLRPPADLAPPPLGTDVLLYYGNGGYPPATLPLNQHTYTKLTAALAGHTVSSTASWPASLDPFALVVLIRTGGTTAGVGLDAAQRTQLAAWIDRGGRLVIQADINSVYMMYDGTAANGAANALLSALGVAITINGNIISNLSIPLNPADPLAKNVGGALTCNTTTSLTIGAAPELRRVDTFTSPVIAAATRGKGEIVVMGDSQCLDDSDAHGAELTAFAKNLVTPRP